MLSVLASLVPTRHKLESFGKKKPQLRNYLIRLACGQASGVFSIDDWYGRTQFTATRGVRC